ncbi:MAG: HAD-IIB family hydrolase [Aphanocapsa lilacina HA4352-LM1]|jgi:HAD superfamily hydrolase (TIGR01484 family)|nr:HAD-IIB family hydrolase [Aphanocapsa lilacina HA4352-LM1]
MHYLALACDYDGTLATDGRVDDRTLEALERLRNSGRKLLLVTGRELDDLTRVFAHLELFERVVAENGALLYRPASKEAVRLGPEPPEAFVERLRERGVSPLSLGRVIVATWEPNETAVLEAIRDLGLELQVIFNKGAVMVLPPGVNKASGLAVALEELGLSAHNVVGVGDAENDHAFLRACECAVAVANALPMLKEQADLVTAGARGAGVIELVERLVDSDLEDLEPGIERHNILLGTGTDRSEISLRPYGTSVLLAGTSGGGKSTFTAGMLERVIEQGYQFCLVDPEGDYEQFEGSLVLGDSSQPPQPAKVLELLAQPDQNVIVNLLGVQLADRPGYFADLLPQLQLLRVQTGRPHWIVVDEAHHLLPSTWDPATLTLPHALQGMVLVTVHPESVSAAALLPVDSVYAVGEHPARTIAAFCERIGLSAPQLDPPKLQPGEVMAWDRHTGEAPYLFRIAPPRAERRRHLRKYAEGKLGEDRSFYFRGPQARLNLRAHNLELFRQMAVGVDEETWLFHLRSGDYSCWFREAIKDRDLAEEAARIEADRALSATESRERILDAVERRYTAPA